MPPGDEEAKHAQTTLFCLHAQAQTFTTLTHPLVQLQPGRETFAILVLEPKEPGFPQPDGLDDLKNRSSGFESVVPGNTDGNLNASAVYLVKELFASRAGQDGKLQLSIHGCNADIYLPGEGGGKNYQTEIRKKKKVPVC